MTTELHEFISWFTNKEAFKKGLNDRMDLILWSDSLKNQYKKILLGEIASNDSYKWLPHHDTKLRLELKESDDFINIRVTGAIQFFESRDEKKVVALKRLLDHQYSLESLSKKRWFVFLEKNGKIPDFINWIGEITYGWSNVNAPNTAISWGTKRWELVKYLSQDSRIFITDLVAHMHRSRICSWNDEWTRYGSLTEFDGSIEWALAAWYQCFPSYGRNTDNWKFYNEWVHSVPKPTNKILKEIESMKNKIS